MSDLKHDATRRIFMTGAVSAAGAAALGCAGASAATEVAPMGPIETLYREWRRSDAVLIGPMTAGRNVTDAEHVWGDEPAHAAMSLTPHGDREWAALMMLALYFSAVDDDHPELWEFCASMMPDLQHPLA